jgi:hypothetical protein
MSISIWAFDSSVPPMKRKIMFMEWRLETGEEYNEALDRGML